MTTVQMKTYGAFYPCTQEQYDALTHLQQYAMGNDEPWLLFEGDMIRVSFEGVYFPEDDFIEAITPMLTTNHTGKLDVIDMDSWAITRYVWDAGQWKKGQRGLNDVLDYSCQKGK